MILTLISSIKVFKTMEFNILGNSWAKPTTFKIFYKKVNKRTIRFRASIWLNPVYHHDNISPVELKV